jgi:hypothetical protein
MPALMAPRKSATQSAESSIAIAMRCSRLMPSPRSALGGAVDALGELRVGAVAAVVDVRDLARRGRRRGCGRSGLLRRCTPGDFHCACSCLFSSGSLASILRGGAASVKAQRLAEK